MSDVSKGTQGITVGVDLGDKYSYLCFLDTESGEIMEEGRVRTTPEALRRRFCSEQQPLRIAIEAGTHSPWVSRVLEECGHEVLVANPRKTRLIYANKRKTDEIDALRTWPAWHASIRSYSTRSNIALSTPRLTWHSYAHARRWSVLGRSL
jgi:transposase